MTSYRINYWIAGKQYTTVISSTDHDYLRKSLKELYDRFTMEEA